MSSVAAGGGVGRGDLAAPRSSYGQSGLRRADGLAPPGVVAGTGRRLLDGSDPTHLKLVRTTTFASGIVVLVYAST
jgi:hypothetical protein